MRVFVRFVLAIVFTLGTGVQAQLREAIRAGEAPREQQLAGGQTHTFEISLAAHDILRVRLDQREIDAALAIRGPDQKVLTEAANAGVGDAEFISILAPAAGVYSIDVRPGAADARPGKYLITVSAAAPATAVDEGLVEADRLFSQANKNRGTGTVAALADALKQFSDARDRYVAAGDDWRTAESWNRIGIVQLSRNDNREAIKAFEASLAVVDRIGDRRWLGVLLNNIGLANWNLSQVEPAVAAYERSLAIRREVGDKGGEASTLFNMALVFTGLGEPDKAIALHEQTLPIRRLVGDRAGEARSLTSLANAYRAIGGFQEAFDNLSKARAIFQAQKDQAGEIDSMRGMASTYLAVGDFDQAQRMVDDALAMARPLGNRRTLSNLQFVVADISSNRGDRAMALDYFGRSVVEDKAISNRIGASTTLLRMGRLQLADGDLATATASQTESIAIARELNDQGNVATALDLGGSIAVARQRYDEASAAFAEELSIWNRTGDRVGQADSEYGLARAMAGKGDIRGALDHAATAVATLESMRASVRNPDLRTSYRARFQRYFELQVDLWMTLHEKEPGAGHDLAALAASDGSRARGLLESFGGNLPDFVQDADPALLADRAAKGRRVNELERRRVQALGDTRTAAAAPTTAELAEALRLYRDAEGKVFASSPRAQALLTPPPVTAASLRAAAGDDAVLVEYALGESRSFVWTVSATGVSSAVLPDRKTIETAATRAYRAVTARNEPAADASVTARRSRLDAADREASAASSALARLILNPIAAQLTGRKRLVLVADGALSIVPFAALPMSAGGKALAEAHPIVLLPSAAMLTAIRRPRAAGANTVAVLADPVFERGDPRVVAATSPRDTAPNTAPALPLELQTAARRDGQTRFGRLRFSREEADAITAMVPKDVGYSALDFSASRAAATSDRVARARIVHFATHGIVNANQPELSGLVLSLVDSKGQSLDGFFRLHDIYRLRLTADLVVLSACRSAVGKDFRGEGPLALTRGFLVAGAPRVVATLWDVDDRATAELMQRFYTGVLVRKESPAAALRSAQAEMAAIPQWSAPYFWAGFTLTGEWR